MPLPPLVDPAAEISDAERTRTARHAVLPGFGEIGQRRLRAATVAVIGAGGLGSPIVLALAAAGVGRLVVIDDDVVEASNLQRQIIHGIADLGAPKVDSAVRAAATLSPETVVAAIRERLEPATATTLLRGADLVIDGSDSFSTRRIVADACEALGLPLVWGTIQGYDAQVTVFWSAPPAGTAALRLDDLYPSGSTGEPPSCAQAGVLGALCLQVGGVMAVEAIKLITGIGESLLGRVLLIDSLRARQREVPLRPSRQAPAAIEVSAVTVPQIHATITAVDLNGTAVSTTATEQWIVDVRERSELDSGMIAGARHVPLAVFVADPTAHLPADASIAVLVCEAGVRSARAADAALVAGRATTVLEGGMAAWRRAELPTATPAAMAR